jgi:RNA polymerase primary sigma factor
MVMTNNALDYYLRKLDASTPLSVKDEVKLFQEYKAGSEDARQKILNANLKFVVKVANNYTQQGELDDLIQEGNIGLMKAAKKFDHERGFKFITYAVSWINQEIQTYIFKHSTNVRVPTDKQKLSRKVYKISCRLEQENQGIAPTEEEIRTQLNPKDRTAFDKSSIRFIKEYSLDTPTDDEHAPTHQFIEDPESTDVFAELENESMKTTIDEVLKKLSVREQEILKSRFGLNGEPLTYREAGEKIGLNKKIAHWVEGEALKKIRRSGHIPALRTAYN